MQKVACPITIVSSDRLTPEKLKNELSAIPVMIPGSASGRTRTNDTTSRPKKRKRCTANAAIEPSTIAITLEMSPARTDSHSDWRMASLLNVCENYFVERPCKGQLCTFEGLNAYRMMSTIGNITNKTTSAAQTQSAIRPPRLIAPQTLRAVGR